MRFMKAIQLVIKSDNTITHRYKSVSMGDIFFDGKEKLKVKNFGSPSAPIVFA